MGLDTRKKIHACANHYVLYKDEFVALRMCPACGLSQFKKKPDETSGEKEIESTLLRCCGTFQ